MDINKQDFMDRGAHRGPDRIRFSDSGMGFSTSRLGWISRFLRYDFTSVIHSWSSRFEKAGLIALLATGLSACALQEPRETLGTKEIRLDLPLSVNGVSGEGVLVVPRSDRYEVKLKYLSKPEMVTLSTCHREIILLENIITYAPSLTESGGYCPMVLTFLARNDEYRGAIVDFSDLELGAILLCNGKTEKNIGVSICQARAGMLQEIIFASPMNVATSVGTCAQPTSNDQLRWQIKLGKGHCVYAFKEKASGKLHRLTTFGYEIWRH
jgi:hypothetical protein